MHSADLILVLQKKIVSCRSHRKIELGLGLVLEPAIHAYYFLSVAEHPFISILLSSWICCLVGQFCLLKGIDCNSMDSLEIMRFI